MGKNEKQKKDRDSPSPYCQPREPGRTLYFPMYTLGMNYSSYLATSEDEVSLDPETWNEIFRSRDFYTPKKVKIQDKHQDKPSTKERESSIPEKATIPNLDGNLEDSSREKNTGEGSLDKQQS
ncbi:hypothetical protein JTB14_036717 [Gonioctena quinquepunctata]|nr:hypothetical protein JTB14_036717 [Gonioctena quinquepunctata]